MQGWFCGAMAGAVLLAGVGAAVVGQEAGGGDRKAVVQGNNDFAFDLYGRLGKKDGNLFFSPYSVSTALAMTYAGARGQTAEQMAHTLHFTLPSGRLHDAFAALQAALQGEAQKRGYELTVANRLWGQKGYHFLPAFLQMTKTRHGAELAEVDFLRHTEQARQTINAWVEKQTRDKIKDLIGRGALDAHTRLVLTNAIYFKGAWANPFPERATRKEDFKLSGGKTKQVRMMHTTEECAYYQGDGLSLVSLPYRGHDLSMVVLLPAEVDGLAALEKSLGEEHVRGWLARAQRRRVTLSLPKFKMTSKFDLEQVLAAMGMPLAFSDRADFSGMSSEEKLAISKVIHQAYVDVNEKGTEAAAATAVVMRPTAARLPAPPATFRADHPFVIVIRDTRTGSILFLGRVANPPA